MAGRFVALEHRTVVTLAGPDRREYLQGLISNDINKCTAGRAIWTAFLTPQGKFLHEFSVIDGGDLFWLECEAARMMDLGQRLRRYQLRSDITLDIGKGLAVFALLDVSPDTFGLRFETGAAAPFAGGFVFVDSRRPEIGLRVVAPKDEALAAFAKQGLAEDGFEAYEAHRMTFGVPEGAGDMEPEKAVLLENGFDELAGVDWKKGCFMGQELTARTKYRGLVKKRLLPVVSLGGDALSGGSRVEAEGTEVGQMRSTVGSRGLALVRLDRWRQAVEQGKVLDVDGQEVTIEVPDWVRLDANTKQAET